MIMLRDQTFTSPSLPLSSSRLLEETPQWRDLASTNAAMNRSISLLVALSHSRSRCQLEIGTSKEAMWLLTHYCTPLSTVRVGMAGWAWL